MLTAGVETRDPRTYRAGIRTGIRAINSIYYGEILGGRVSWAGLGGWAGSWVREFGRPVGWAGSGWAGRLGWVALVRGFCGSLSGSCR